MAVDTTQIENLYDSLEAKVRATLETEFDNDRLDRKEYTKVLETLLGEVLQLSVTSVLQQELNEAQVKQIEASIKSDNALKQAALKKDYGYDSSIVNDNVVLGTNTEDGLKDQQIAHTRRRIL